VAAGFQVANGCLLGPRDLFDDPNFDLARQRANEIADYLRRHGPFEPHRLPEEDMEYTTLPRVIEKLRPSGKVEKSPAAVAGARR
jgi:fructose 1,6-bisphosphate aldolase/phosphatase